jgi:hypothetical protein
MNVSFFMKAVMRSILLLCVVGVFLACEHGMPVMQQAPPANLQATLSSIQANIFTPKCAISGCHLGGNASGNPPMSLATGVARNNLVNVISGTYNQSRVVPTDATNSVLYQKVIGTKFGSQMPPTGPPFLSQAEKDSIAAWIIRGALNN